MDAPLLALRELFGEKAHLLKYLPLGQNACFHPFPTCFSILFPHLLRSNSERDHVARRFLETNFEAPMQKLVSDWLMAGAVVPNSASMNKVKN